MDDDIGPRLQQTKQRYKRARIAEQTKLLRAQIARTHSHRQADSHPQEPICKKAADIADDFLQVETPVEPMPYKWGEILDPGRARLSVL